MWISRIVAFYTNSCFIVVGNKLLFNFRPIVCIVSIIAYVKFCLRMSNFAIKRICDVMINKTVLTTRGRPIGRITRLVGPTVCPSVPNVRHVHIMYGYYTFCSISADKKLIRHRLKLLQLA